MRGSSSMNNARGAKLYYALAVAGSALALPLALYLVMGFDVRDPRWWSWLWRYYRSQDELPPRLLWTGLAWLLGTTLIIGLCPFSLAPSQYGRARWAKGRLKLWWMGLTAKYGMVLGRIGSRLLISSKILSVLILAPSRTGKTRGTIIPTVLAYRGSVIVHDPKSEVFDASAGHRAKLGRVLRLEWSSPVGSVCWNPLSAGNLPGERGGRGHGAHTLGARGAPRGPKSFRCSLPRLALAAVTLYLLYEPERPGGPEPAFLGLLPWLIPAVIRRAPR